MNKLVKDNQTLYYVIEEKKIKHSYFKPQNGYLLIVKSKYMVKDKVMDHLLNHFDKYILMTKKIPDNELLLWGNTYKLKVNNGAGFTYQIKDNEIEITTELKDILKIKVNILTVELEKYLTLNRTKYKNVINKYGIDEVPLVLKYLKSKYGSYHYKTNRIVLNVFLATLEKSFTDYVLYHEYAHQKEKNHQKGFYNLLKKLFTDYKIYDQKLKQIAINI